MNFEHAVTRTRGLEHAYQVGLHALTNADRRRIECSNPETLTGSVNLDSALASTHPDSPRWDYGIGLRIHPRSERVTWLEVHPATSRGAKEVCNKHLWLTQWLESSAPLLRSMTGQFVWLASGNVHIPLNSPHRKRVAAQGIRFAGQRLHL